MTGTASLREFAVWAPNASRGVEVLLGEERHPMTVDAKGWFHALSPAGIGTPYGYALDGGPAVTDPRARSAPAVPGGLTPVTDLEFAWTDDDYSGVELEGAVIYEAHVGSFTPKGSFDGLLGKLDHLAELGIDLLQLLPVAAAGEADPWGYDVIAPWAVHEGYGGPPGLQRLVDACHARAIGVGIDLPIGCVNPSGSVLNHFGPYYQGSYVTTSGWAANFDGPLSDDVRAYWVACAQAWLADFHLDALRLPDAADLSDRRALTFLEELSATVRAYGGDRPPRRWIIADDDRQDPRTVLPVDEGGLGCDALLADDLGREILTVLSGQVPTPKPTPDPAVGPAPVDDAVPVGYAEPVVSVLDDLAGLLGNPFWYAGTFSRRHGRTNGRPLDPGRVPGWRFVAALDRCGPRPWSEEDATLRRRAGRMASWRRCGAAALQLTSAYTPMIRMGEEWASSWRITGEGRPEPLDWSESDTGDHAKVLSWYRALLALRAARPELREPTLSHVQVTVASSGALVVQRGRHRIAVNATRHPVFADLDLASTHRQVALLSLDPTVTVGDDGLVLLPPDGLVVVGPVSSDKRGKHERNRTDATAVPPSPSAAGDAGPLKPRRIRDRAARSGADQPDRP